MEFFVNRNQVAFLNTIGRSEGADYNTLVGGGRFDSYADHPRILVDLGNGLKSTAAGKFQILEHIFDFYKKSLDLPDFSPTSQDTIALQLIKEREAIDDINNGDITSAITKCSSAWASFPGNDYGQHQNNMQDLLDFYKNAGGSLTSNS